MTSITTILAPAARNDLHVFPSGKPIESYHFEPYNTKICIIFEKFLNFEEELTNPTGATTFSQIFLRILFSYEDISICVRAKV